MSLTDAQLRQLAEAAGAALLAAGQCISTAESCTGGWIAKALTDVPGSSRWFERGYVTYSNAAKQQDLGVEAALLEREGAVSQPAVEQMAAGALRASGADWALAVSGIAGPDGGSAAKPVGLVWLALAGRAGAAQVERHQFAGDREAVRRAAAAVALRLIAGAPQLARR
jgi:nicotinamide-nucleotide amidase